MFPTPEEPKGEYKGMHKWLVDGRIKQPLLE